MAAHDLRNPNTLIRLYLNQLIESLEDINEEQHVWISKIQSISDSMLDLVNDFLDISTIEAGQLRLNSKLIILNAFLTIMPWA
jgi:signal transduction histidine kinase